MVQLVTASNTLGRSYDYDAFGNEVSPSASDTNPFRYAGQYFDSETGTYYLRARYYDPGIGRFTQQDGWVFADPSDPLSLNLYTYCYNNPIRYIDLSGESPTDVFAGFLFALDEGIAGGFSQWVVKKYIYPNTTYQKEDESDYYLGRILGDLVSMFLGAGLTAKGLTDFISAMYGGAAVTLVTAGAGSGVGAVVSVGGAVVGTLEIGVGGVVTYVAASNLGDDWDKFSNSRISNVSKQESSVWNSFDKIKGSSRRTSGSGKNKKYYEWDYTHNDIEVYDNKGNHLGSMNPETGEMYKEAVKGRKIRV